MLSHHDRITGVRLDDGNHVDLDALVVSTIVHARTDFLAPLGLLPTNFTINGHVTATRIETGPNGASTVPGVRIAGNTSSPWLRSSMPRPADSHQPPQSSAKSSRHNRFTGSHIDGAVSAAPAPGTVRACSAQHGKPTSSSSCANARSLRVLLPSSQE